jgi:general secretion pathway protein F
LKDVLAGAQLSEAMGKRSEVFPPDYRAILSAGEAGGVTGQVLKQIADLLVRRLEIRGKITSALLYPIILILMSLVSVTVIVFVLIPSISPIFIDAGLPLPGILSVFADIQDNWFGVSAGIAVALAACAVLWRRARQNDGLMLALDRLKSTLPIIGKLIQAREAGGFARALGTLLGARVPLMSAMQTARALVINRHLNALYQHAIGRVPEGTPLHRAFDGTGLLPAASLRLIAVGEESGQLAGMLMQVATVIEADLQRHIERMVSLLTPMLTLVVGGSIGGLIMHVMSAVLSINNLAFQ